MRLAITILALIVYVGLFNIYIYELPKTYFTIPQIKALFFFDTIFISTFREIDRFMGFTSFYHYQFNVLCYVAFIANLIICLLIVTEVMDKTKWQTNLYIFNGSIFVMSVLIYISMAQHGYFKDRYEND